MDCPMPLPIEHPDLNICDPLRITGNHGCPLSEVCPKCVCSIITQSCVSLFAGNYKLRSPPSHPPMHPDKILSTFSLKIILWYEHLSPSSNSKYIYVEMMFWALDTTGFRYKWFLIKIWKIVKNNFFFMISNLVTDIHFKYFTKSHTLQRVQQNWNRTSC